MTTKTLATVGTFTEVAFHEGAWYVCWQDGTNLRIQRYSADLSVQSLDLRLHQASRRFVVVSYQHAS